MQEYNTAILVDRLQRLQINQDNNIVTTKYDGRVINESLMSDKYGVFPFGRFVSDILPDLEQQFRPINMDIDIYEGIQDLRFMSKKFTVANDVFQFMLSILSSSDGTKKLSMRGGLLRQVCSNGMMGLTESAVFVACKHFKGVVEERVSEFKEGLSRIKQSNNEQLRIIRDLPGVEIDLPTFARNFCYEKVENKKILVPERFIDLRQLANKLINSETDRLDLSLLNKDQKIMLFEPKRLLEVKTPLIIDRYQLFNNYMEIHRNQAADVIAKHSKLILEKIM